MTVDTLSIVGKLRVSEPSRTRAEAIAAAIGRFVIEGAATKAYIGSVRSDLAQTGAELGAEIGQLRLSLMIQFIGTNLTLAAIIIAVVKL